MSRLCVLFVAATFACATQRPAPEALNASVRQEHLFVGHSDTGEMLIATSHVDAMRGLAVPASELDVKGGDPDGSMLCRRETPTGTHVPQWTCRFAKEMERDRLGTLLLLDRIPKKCMSAEYCIGD